MTKRSKIFIWLALGGLVFVGGVFIVFSFAFSPTGPKPNITKSATPITTPSPIALSAPLSNTFEPESVSFVTADLGFILGTAPCESGSCLTIARTQDGGSTWSSIPAPNISLSVRGDSQSKSGAVSKIVFLTVSDGYLFGPDLYATKDGGTTWKRILLLGIAKDYEVTSLGTHGVETYLLASNPNESTNAAFLFISRKPTSPFVIQVTPVLPPGSGTEIISNPYGFVISTSNKQNIILYQESGKRNWLKTHVACSDPFNNPLITLAAPDSASSTPELLLACGGNAGAGSQEKSILRSKDMKTFEASLSNPPRDGMLEAIASPDGKTIAVAASSGATYLYVSTDSGTTWKTAFSDSTLGGAPIHDLGFTTPTQGFAVMGHVTPGGANTSTLLMTRDRGISWQAVTF